MSETLYRVKPKPNGLFEVVSVAESMRSKHCIAPASERPNDHCFEGEWYCQSEDCVVREVSVRVKLHGAPMPSRLLCPCCRKAMKFHHWLTYETLVPVEGA